MREFPLVRDFESLRLELRRYFAARQASVRLEVLYAQPAKYENGDVVYADGTSWNPGSGAGVYARESGAWVKL